MSHTRPVLLSSPVMMGVDVRRNMAWKVDSLVSEGERHTLSRPFSHASSGSKSRVRCGSGLCAVCVTVCLQTGWDLTEMIRSLSMQDVKGEWVYILFACHCKQIHNSPTGLCLISHHKILSIKALFS